MKLRVMALLAAMMMMASVSAFAAQENPPPPPDIKEGPPSGSCCRAGGREGSSELRTHSDGVTEWVCHWDSKAFQQSWNKGLLPYNLFDYRLRGPIGTWSAWFNSDGPGGVGDYELLKGLVDSKKVCNTPLVIECQTVKGGIDSSKSQSVYHCDLSKGGYCVNKEQVAGKQCEDFKVRYLCSAITAFQFTGSTSF